MSSVALFQDTFSVQAISAIFEETQQAMNTGKYTGVTFEGGRKEIWIWYDHLGSSMGQEQRYSAALWQDICLAMRLLGRLAYRLRCQDLVRLREGVGCGCARWTIYPQALGTDYLPKLTQLLHRVDETMVLLDQPL